MGLDTDDVSTILGSMGNKDVCNRHVELTHVLRGHEERIRLVENGIIEIKVKVDSIDHALRASEIDYRRNSKDMAKLDRERDRAITQLQTKIAILAGGIGMGAGVLGGVIGGLITSSFGG